MLSLYERKCLKQLHSVVRIGVSDMVCAGIDRLTRGELRRVVRHEVAELRSSTLAQRMLALRARLVNEYGEGRGISVGGTRAELLTTLGRLRRAMAVAPRWRTKDPVLEAPIPADFINIPEQP